MKLILNLFYLALCIMICSFSAENKMSTIGFTCKKCVGMEISLSNASILRSTFKKIYRSTFDSSGLARIQFTHTDTLRFFLRIGENDTLTTISTPLYIEPGTNTDLLFENGILTFQGDLKAVNSYGQKLLKVGLQKSDYENANNHKYRESSDEEKESYLAKISGFGQELNQKIRNDLSLSPYYKELLINFNCSTEITLGLIMDSEKVLKIRNTNKQNEQTVIPDPISSNIFGEFVVNQYLLQDSWYLLGLSKLLGPKIDDIWQYYDENRNKIKVSRYEYLRNLIIKNPDLIKCQDLIMALSITHISYWDFTRYDDLREMTRPFEKDYPLSKYILELHDILAEHGELRNGMAIKDFAMQDVNGNEFKLSSLKNNLVYIDVWATWCGPCREEFKHSVKLSKKYAARTDLKFLYVSVDRNPELWKNFLKKNSSLKGIHGIQSPVDIPPDPNSIRNLYKINGIPRYILISKDGKIIDHNAPRPSQLLTSNYLDSLLTL